jgi:VWFA-related protein
LIPASAYFLLAAALSLQPQPIFRVPVRIVEVPLAVTGADGKLVRGLGRDDFALFDNGRLQPFHLDEAGQAFSLAIAIQTNVAVRAWLPEVGRSASAVEALVLGSQGEAAIVTFADEVTVLQETTSDAPHLDNAFRNLKPSGDKSRSIDAVLKATQLLSEAPPGRRRALLLIAQAGDIGSKAELREVMTEVERKNITVFCLTMPRVGRDLLGSVRLSGLGSPGSRDTGFVVSADLTKLVPEIYRGSKTAAGEDAVTLLTRYTSGTMIPFRSRKDLDAAISSIGEELHTGYLLTYTPNDASPGYHRIAVTVARDGALVRARPGYYVAEP